MRLKKIIWATTISTILVCLSIFGCAKPEPAPDKKGLKILATFLPMYIITQNVVAGVDGVEVEVLLPPEGAGPHGYHLTPGDMKKIADADVLVVNGHNLDDFMGAPEKTNPDIRVILTSDGIDTLPDISHNDDHEGEHGTVNPHLWVSPRIAALQAVIIGASLQTLDKDNAGKYNENVKMFMAELAKLNDEFKKAVASFPNKKIVTVHNAFDYFARDIGLEVVAVLRVDPTSAPRSRELAEIAETIRAKQPGAIFVEPQFSDKLARVLSEETGVTVYTLDPVATGELRSDYYIEAMNKNLRTLKEALGN